MAKLPLEGVRIVAIPVVWAGPFATQLLADMGAELILVESIQHYPSATRGVMLRPPKELVEMMPILGKMYVDKDPGGKDWNRTSYFNRAGRNKLSCCIDLERPQGVDIFRRLIQVSDAFLENNAAGVMERLGITYDVAKEWKPDIIWLNMPSYGMTGPYKYYMGFGDQAEALAGHHWLRGTPGPNWPVTNTTVFHMDNSGGVGVAFAIMAALHYRNRTGKGQYIDVAQIETVLPHLAEPFMDYTWNNRSHQSIGNRDFHGAVQGCYRCRGEDRWVAITITSDKEWEGLCRAIGNPPWTREERFSDATSRYNNHDELDKLIEEWTLCRDHYHVMHILQKEGVPAGPVLDARDANNDPQLISRGFFETVTHPECGTHRYPGVMWKYSETPMSIRMPAPCLGEHNDYVFREVIGMSDEEIAELEKEQIIGGDAYV